jgi:hypothetical protein
LKQGGLLGQEKIDQSGQTAAAKLAAVSGHYANEAAHWGNQDQSATDKNQTAADALAAKTAAANANPPKMSFADQEKLKHLYALLTDAQVKFNAINSQKDPDGALKAVNKINTFQKQIAEMTAPMAGSTLQAGTGTTSAPDDSAAAALVPSPNLPANPKATSQSPSGNYSAPTFQSSAAAALTPTSPGTGQRKVATDADFATALKKAGGNVKSARQWLQDNGFTIPQ